MRLSYWPAQAELQPITWRDRGQITIFADFSWPAGPMISTEVECSFSLFSLVVSPPMTTTRVELSFSSGHTFYRINNIKNHFLVFHQISVGQFGSLGPRLHRLSGCSGQSIQSQFNIFILPVVLEMLNRAETEICGLEMTITNKTILITVLNYYYTENLTLLYSWPHLIISALQCTCKGLNIFLKTQCRYYWTQVKQSVRNLYPGGHKEMSSIWADQLRHRIHMSDRLERKRHVGECGLSLAM
jgi:hypothetical protein